MKKKIIPLQKNFQVLHLYRDDLEAIENILTSELKAKGFTIANDKYEYASTKEIDQHTLPSNNLEIKTFPPYTSITLEKSGARIYFSENSLAEEGAFIEICSIIKNRQRKIIHIISNPLLVSLLSFLMLTFSREVPRKTLNNNAFDLAFITYASLVFIWFMFSFYIRWRKYSTVDFVKKSQRPNFLNRNRDQIALNIVFTVLGTFLGFILSRIWTK